MADFLDDDIISSGSSIGPGDVVRTYADTYGGKALLALDGASYLRSAYPNIETFFPTLPGAGLTAADTSAISFGTSSRVRFSPKMIASNGSGVVIAASNNAGGTLSIIRSTDGGLSWSEVFNTGQSQECRGIHFCNNGYAYLFTSQNGNAPGHCFRSDDSGSSWNVYNINHSTAPVIDSAYDAVSDHLYVVYNTVASNLMTKTSNASTSSPVTSFVSASLVSAPIGITVQNVGATQTVVVVASNQSYYSQNGGSSWTTGGTLSGKLRQGQLMMENNILFACTVTNEVHKSTDNGASWVKVASPLDNEIGVNNFSYENGYLVVFSLGTTPDRLAVSGNNGETFDFRIDLDVINADLSRTVHVSPQGDLFLASQNKMAISVFDSNVFYLPDITSKYPEKIIAE